MIEQKLEPTIPERRLLASVSLDDKLEIQTWTENFLRWCAYCDSGIATDKKPIYYEKKDKETLKSCLQTTHSGCYICLTKLYHDTFGLSYEEVLKHGEVKKTVEERAEQLKQTDIRQGNQCNHNVQDNYQVVRIETART